MFFNDALKTFYLRLYGVGSNPKTPKTLIEIQLIVSKSN